MKAGVIRQRATLGPALTGQTVALLVGEREAHDADGVADRLPGVWLPQGPRPWEEKQRAAWLAETGYDPSLWTGRRRRSGVQRAPLAGALLRRGLIEIVGFSHRDAIRQWLIWEGGLQGPALRNPGVQDAWRQLQGAPPTGAAGLHGFLDSWRDVDRRYWEAMGISR